MMTFATNTSAVLDAYTSILSRDDTDGELAELYFTNTGFGLLAVSLASSVAMNLLLPDLALNMIVAGTFAMTWVASLAVAHAKYTLPRMWYRYEVALSTTYISILTSHIVISKLNGTESNKLWVCRNKSHYEHDSRRMLSTNTEVLSLP